jgi:hypothetical protein
MQQIPVQHQLNTTMTAITSYKYLSNGTISLHPGLQQQDEAFERTSPYILHRALVGTFTKLVASRSHIINW